MDKSFLIILAVLLCACSVSAQKVSISSEMHISQSTRFKKDIYKIDAPPTDAKGVITIEGNDIVIDFNYAELRGDVSVKRPDEFFGIGIFIRNSKNVTIKNLKARGYKVALLARNTENLVLENCDFSYNYRPHLNSTQEKEDISDWMSYHHNEKDEWLRYGAAMYLRGCNFFTVRDCKVTGGQNALMMTECNDGLVVNNDFSFNSGIGIGMYRSSRNRIIYNRIIFNVRGYSHGVYNRGQDSAGILIYEQSNNNLFYKNNVTHGGDGFFLWAGQTTMDTGEGGCNDNMLWGNDFSYAPTNGIEATFSKNYFYSNIIYECDHGIWGGYSYGSTIRNCRIRFNRVGIAIEHGQDNYIYMNVFEGNKTAIKLWANKIEPSDWGYPKKRDTRSWHYEITNNFFLKNGKAFNFSNTDSLVLAENYVDTNETTLLLKDSTLRHWGVVYNNDTTARPFLEGDMIGWPDSITKAGKPIMVTDPTYAGRKNIMITEWGPYDFRYPLIWNTNPTSKSDTMEFELFGPKGKWEFVKVEGGNYPYARQDFLDSTKSVYDITDLPRKFYLIKDTLQNEWEAIKTVLVLGFKGASFVDQFGKRVPANKPYRVRFQKFFQPINWEVNYYRLDTASHNPIRAGTLFSITEKKAPFKTERVNKIDYAWWGGIKEAGVQYPQFITVADGTATITKGDYELSVTWDDAVRVYVDDKLVLDEWNPSKYTFDESPHKKVTLELGGDHHFRVEHLELGGFATLALKIKPVER